MQINATLYRSGSDSCQSITIGLTPQGLSVECPEGTMKPQVYPYNQLSLSTKLGQLPTVITVAELGNIEFRQQPDFDRQLRIHHSPRKPWLYWFEGARSFWFACVLLVPLLFYLCVEYVVPTMAKSVVGVLPYSVARHVEDETLQLMQDRFVKESKVDQGTQAKVLTQFNQLLAQLQLSDSKYRLFFKQSEFYGANAFALPGGAIVITDDLYTLFKDKPDALQAIFLHEIAHVEYQHGLQVLAETVTTTLLLNYFLGDLQGMAELLSASSMTLLQNNFSRSLEGQADDYALAKMAELGISPDGFIDAMTAFEIEQTGQAKMMQYFSSHPQISDRIKKAKQAAKD
ncbi:M48 family metallopeptidase [Thalassotalea aquiviva]|uniref:M48 family metallopeptidase n=1 Tax=Thalassotalea aquiviva TaxID=3242415 RepID=UPI00352AA1A8